MRVPVHCSPVKDKEEREGSSGEQNGRDSSNHYEEGHKVHHKRFLVVKWKSFYRKVKRKILDFHFWSASLLLFYKHDQKYRKDGIDSMTDRIQHGHL